MAADKDYVLGVAVQLQTESVAAFEAEVRRQLENAATNIEKKPFKVKIQTQFEGMNSSQVQQMTRDYDNLSSSITKSAGTMNDLGAAAKKASAEVKSAAVQAKTEIQGFFDSASGRALDNENSDLFGVRNLKAQLSEYKATVAQMADEHRQINEMLSANTAFQDRQRELRGIGASWDQNLISGTDGAMLEKQQRVIDKYVPMLNNAAKAQKSFAEQLFATSGAADHFIKSMGNIITWGAGIGIVYGAGNTALKGIQDALHSQQEQVIQGFYYRGQGQQFGPQTSASTMQAAIDLARKYGDDVMQVQEAIGLWAKSTKGELLPSFEMANEALKLNSVTGMNNEEIYRSTIAVLSQYHQSLSKANDIYNVGVGLATRYGGGIKALGGESQDATRQMIEGMDASAAAASGFGLKIEQTAALLAVMIQTGNKSGTETGDIISRSFAAFERPQSQQALEKMGIAIHNNSKFLDELKDKWDKVVPGMGNTLGNILTSHVSSSANEGIHLLVESLGQYQQAERQAYEYEKSHPLDQMYKQMKETDTFKLNQLKASFEALSIVVGRQFLDPMGKAMDEVEKFMPLLISLGPVIGGVATTLAKLGLGWGAIQVIKLLGSTALATQKQWQEFSAAMSGGATSIEMSMQVASTALTAEQKKAIEALTSNQTVTYEMEQQWKTLAVNQGVSIDTMIGAMAKLKADTSAGAASIIVSEDSIATNMESVAAQLGVEETQVVAAFDGMATGANRAASVISGAFLKAIPIIGQVLLLSGLAQTAYDAFNDRQHKIEYQELANDPSGRMSLESSDLWQANVDKSKIEELKRKMASAPNYLGGSAGYTLAGMLHLLPDSRHPLASKQAIADEINKLQADESAKLTEWHNLKSGYAWTQFQSVDQQIAAEKAGLQKALSGKITPPGGKESGNPAAAPQKGLSTDYGREGLAISSADSAYKKYLASKNASIDADKNEATRLQGLISLYGNNEQVTTKLVSTYKNEALALAGKLTIQESYYNGLEKTYRADEAQASKYGKNTKEYAGFTHDANTARNAASSLLPQIQATRDTLKELSLVSEPKALKDLVDYEEKIASSNASSVWKQAEDDFKAHKITLSQLADAANTFAAAMKNVASAYSSVHMTTQANAATDSGASATSDVQAKFSQLSDYISSQTQSLNDKIFGNDLAMSSASPEDSAFARAVRSAREEFDSFNKDWDKWVKDDGDSQQLEHVKSLATAWYQSSIALAQYNQALAQAKASPTYAAITTLGNDIGNTVSSDVMSMFTQGDRNQISAIQSQIVALENEKNLLTGQNNIVERDMLDRKIKQLQAEENGINQRMQHPNFLKAIQEDMVKAIMKGLTDKFTKSLQDAFLNSILPKQQTVQDQANIKIDANTTAHQQNTTAIGQLNDNIVRAIQYVSNSSNRLSSVGDIAAASAGFGADGAFSSMGAGSSLSGSTVPQVSSSGSFTGGSVPNFTSSGAFSGAAPLAVMQAMLGMQGALSSVGSNPFGSQFGSSSGNDAIDQTVALMSGTPQSIKGGFWSNGKGNAQHIMGALGGLSMAVQGYDQGGFTGSLESGIGMFEALSSVGVPPQIAIPVAAVDFLLSMFHPHYNPSQNPDMFAQSGFAQGVANAQGFAATQATGGVYEDPGLKQQLGGMTQLQYLNAWYNQYPGGQGLNTEGKQLWDEIGHITGNGKGFGVTGLHQGNVYVSTSGDPGSPQVGESGNWQQVLQDIDSATNQLYALENRDMSGKGTWISVNSYGAGGGGSASFSPWSTPGLSSSDVGSVMAMPYPALGSNASIGTSIGPDPGSPSGGPGGGGPGGVGGPGVAPMSVTSNVYLNSDLIAQQVNSYNIQRTTSGFSQNY